MPIKAACSCAAVTLLRLGNRPNIPVTASRSLSKALTNSNGAFWRSLENLRTKSVTSQGISESNHGRAARVKRTANGSLARRFFACRAQRPLMPGRNASRDDTPAKRAVRRSLRHDLPVATLPVSMTRGVAMSRTPAPALNFLTPREWLGAELPYFFPCVCTRGRPRRHWVRWRHL